MKMFILLLLLLGSPVASAYDVCRPDVNSDRHNERLARYVQSVMSVSYINSKNERELLGTASLIDDRGYFLTAWHVVKYHEENNLPIHLTSPVLIKNDVYYFDAEVFKHNEESDMAILRIDEKQWNDHRWVSSEKEFMLNFNNSKKLLDGYFYGFGREKVNPNTAKYSTDSISSENSSMYNLKGAPTGGDSGALLLNNIGFGVAIVISKGEKDDDARQLFGLSIGSQLDFLAQIPLSEKGEKFIDDVLSEENTLKVIDDLIRNSGPKQVELLAITSILMKMETDNPSAYTNFYANGGWDRLIRYAYELCSERELLKYAMDVLMKQTLNASLESAIEMASSFSNTTLKMGLESLNMQIVGNDIQFSKQVQQGLSFAVENRFKEIEEGSKAVWNGVDGIVPKDGDATRLVLAANQTAMMMPNKNLGREEMGLDQSLVSIAETATRIESSFLKVQTFPYPYEYYRDLMADAGPPGEVGNVLPMFNGYIWADPTKMNTVEKNKLGEYLKNYDQNEWLTENANQSAPVSPEILEMVENLGISLSGASAGIAMMYGDVGPPYKYALSQDREYYDNRLDDSRLYLGIKNDPLPVGIEKSPTLKFFGW